MSNVVDIFDNVCGELEETDKIFTSKNGLKSDFPMRAREISNKLRQLITGCCSSEIKLSEHCDLKVLLAASDAFAGIDSEDLIRALNNFERQITNLAQAMGRAGRSFNRKRKHSGEDKRSVCANTQHFCNLFAQTCNDSISNNKEKQMKDSREVMKLLLVTNMNQHELS